MLQAILNKSCRLHPTKQQLYGHLPPITKTIKVRWTRNAGHYSRSKDQFISDVLLWTLSRGRAKAGRPDRIYIQQLCADTGCSPEPLPEAMNDSGEKRSGISVLMARYDDDNIRSNLIYKGSDCQNHDHRTKCTRVQILDEVVYISLLTVVHILFAQLW